MGGMMRTEAEPQYRELIRRRRKIKEIDYGK